MRTAKIYYLNQTGEVILHIPENQSQWAVQTSREQDEQLYTPLQTYNPQEVGLIELQQGQYASDFVSATNYKVNIETMELVFEYPLYYPSITEKLQQITIENQQLFAENVVAKEQLLQLQEENQSLQDAAKQSEADNLLALEALADVYEMVIASQGV